MPINLTVATLWSKLAGSTVTCIPEICKGTTSYNNKLTSSNEATAVCLIPDSIKLHIGVPCQIASLATLRELVAVFAFNLDKIKTEQRRVQVQYDLQCMDGREPLFDLLSVNVILFFVRLSIVVSR